MAKPKKNYKLRIIIFLIISAILCTTLFFSAQIETYLNNLLYPEINTNVDECELRVHFIDVGQGDSILIELPDDKLMLVDAGPGSSEDKLIDYLNTFFQTRQNLDINYFVVTHQDEDHIGGADKVFEYFNVLTFFRPGVYTEQEVAELKLSDAPQCNTLAFRTMIARMKEEGCPSYQTQNDNNLFNLDYNCGYTIQCLSPTQKSYSDANNYSAVLMITYEQRKILLTGDAEKQVEEELVSNYGNDLKADILKLGHHGSNTSSTLEFLNAVSPSYVAISVGKDNKYGHPTNDVIARVNGIVGENNVYRTDLNGNIVFGIDKDEQSGKGEIRIMTLVKNVVRTKLQWWCVVVIFEGVAFAIIFLTKAQQKQLQKNIKNNNKNKK